jgi:hypothetical protein
MSAVRGGADTHVATRAIEVMLLHAAMINDVDILKRKIVKRNLG